MSRFRIHQQSWNKELQNYHLFTTTASYYLVLAKITLSTQFSPKCFSTQATCIRTFPSNQAFQWSHYNEQIKSLTLHFLSSYIPSPINSESILVDPRMGEPALEMDRENSDEVSQILEQMSHTGIKSGMEYLTSL